MDARPRAQRAGAGVGWLGKGCFPTVYLRFVLTCRVSCVFQTFSSILALTRTTLSISHRHIVSRSRAARSPRRISNRRELCPKLAMPRYFLRVSLEHLSFRIPSLLSIAKQFNFDITLVSEDLERGVLIIDLEKEEYLNHLLDRATLIM